MTKLILSSCDFRNPISANCIYDNLPQPVEHCRVLYFPNEKATAEMISGDKFYHRLAAFGFKHENIDVFNYFSPSDFHFPPIDVIYISGGNTFGTLKRLRESGADKIIVDYVNQGVTYIGGSAGAHIASANIAHVKKYDGETFGLNDFTGLKLFDGILICHYSDERYDDYIYLREQSEFPVSILTDQEAIVIK